MAFLLVSFDWCPLGIARHAVANISQKSLKIKIILLQTLMTDLGLNKEKPRTCSAHPSKAVWNYNNVLGWNTEQPDCDSNATQSCSKIRQRSVWEVYNIAKYWLLLLGFANGRFAIENYRAFLFVRINTLKDPSAYNDCSWIVIWYALFYFVNTTFIDIYTTH